MNAKTTVAIGTVGTLTLALAVAGLAQTPGTAFTYQGRLKANGSPTTGSHDMRFRLWLGETDPNNPIGPVVCKDNVAVSDGLFTTQLDFGPNVIIGFPLWLGIEVRADATPGNCGSGAFETLAPRQPLTPAPYAVFATTAQTAGLRLPFDGEANSGPAAALLDLENTLATNATSFAGIFRVHSTGSNTRAITGIAGGGSGATYGVYGQNNSTAGVGVHGESFGIAGVRGVANNASVFNYGVFGESVSTVGVGVFGIASATSGINFGVRGVTNSPNGYAGFFAGGRSCFSGRLGVGTLEPLAQLDVVDNTTAAEALFVRNTGAGRAASFESLGAGGTSAVRCYKAGGPALHVLGTFSTAGTVATDAPLAVAGGADSALSGGGFIVCGSVNGVNISIDNNEIMARNSGAAAPLTLNNEGGNVHLIPSGTGGVGIGTNAPQQKLDVSGSIRLTNGLYFGSAVVSPDGFSDNVLSFGDPGIGEDYMTYAEGEFWFQDSPGGGDTSGPTLYASDFVSSSDIRLKKDIEPLTRALDAVLRLQGLRYRFDGTKVDPAGDPAQEDPRLHIGFSAQAVAEVVPEVVRYSARFDKYGISYGGLAPLLVEAIKEQQTLIDEQRATINAQQTMIDAIRAEIRELQARRTD